MSCRFVATAQPRVVPNRHIEDCAHDDCPGCQPCTEPHCRCCGRTHANGTCAECLADSREALHTIARRCDSLPAEVEARGIDGEAMMLLGPAANFEARGHLEASVLAGRVSREAIESSHLKGCDDPRCLGCAGELHPEFVLGRWEDVWRDALEHDPPADRFEMAATVDYIDRTMSYMADYPHVPFEDFAKDLRRCGGHLEAVLHDQSRGDRANVGCFECGGDLERRIGDEGFEDFWTCDKCRRRYTSPEYNFALRAKLEEATKQEESA